MVKKFLRSEMVEPSLARNSTDSHTQTVSPDKRHLQVINLLRVVFYAKRGRLKLTIVGEQKKYT